MIWHVAEIRNDGHLCAVCAEGEGDRIGGIVGNLESVNVNVADDKTLTGLNGFESAEPLAERVRKRAAKRIHRGLGNEKRGFPKTEHLRQTVAMVGVLVGDENTVDAVDGLFDGREPRESFAFAEAAVHEESGALSLEQGDVARAARRQNGNPQADRLLLVAARKAAELKPGATLLCGGQAHKRIFRMMAERSGFVNDVVSQYD
jgi:hypothetical protein